MAQSNDEAISAVSGYEAEESIACTLYVVAGRRSSSESLSTRGSRNPVTVRQVPEPEGRHAGPTYPRAGIR